MRTLVFIAVMSALVLCTDGRVVTKEEEAGKLMWRDESEVPKSCWKYYFECLSGCVANDEKEREEYFWCMRFCGDHREICQRDAQGYWDAEGKTVEDLRRKY